MRPANSLAATVTGLLLLSTLVSGCLRGVLGDDTAHDLVSGEKYSKLVVEIDHASGFAPRSAATELLQTRINERLTKPGGVTFASLEPFTASDTEYTIDEIRAKERQLRDTYASHDTTVLYILYLNGHSASDDDDGKVLGVHYNPGAIAIFKNTIDTSGGTFGVGADAVEKAVLVHEFGHAIGLVNNGIPMVTPHEDAGHRGHSTNEDSVMYWAVENTLGIQGLLGTIPNQFDENDIADVRAAGGK